MRAERNTIQNIPFRAHAKMCKQTQRCTVDSYARPCRIERGNEMVHVLSITLYDCPGAYEMQPFSHLKVDRPPKRKSGRVYSRQRHCEERGGTIPFQEFDDEVFGIQHLPLTLRSLNFPNM